jgi:AraC-like DNA-binding protein
MNTRFMPAAGRSHGRLPTSTARMGRYVQFDKVGAASTSAPTAPSEGATAYEDPGEVLVLAFVMAGAVASTAGRETLVRSRGDMALSLLTRVDAVRMTEDYRAVSLRIDSQMLSATSREIDCLMMRRFSQSEPIPRLLGMMCRELLSPTAAMGPGTKKALSDSVVNLCAGLVDDTLARTSPPELKARNVVAQATKYIEMNASSPSVDPQRVADALRISVRTLHKAFENEPLSVGQAILSARLSTAGLLLATEPILIEEVANRSGFTSGSSFSRAFKRTYEMTPREWRKAHGRST